MADRDAAGDAPMSMSAARVGLAVAAMGLVFTALVFTPAGRLDWTPGWVYVGLLMGWVLITWLCLLRWNPELIEHRMHIGRGTKTWDKVWAALFSPVMIAVYGVAGFEARDAASIPTAAEWLLGLAIFAPGAALLTWSMVVNPFFEKTVRIQTERGHHVIDSGPYARVRHPGYVGFALWILAAPLLLGSAWAFAPAVLAVAGTVIRTALEDRTLRAELPGYSDYAVRVRARLIPGVW